MPSWERLILDQLRSMNNPIGRIDHFFGLVVAASIEATGLSSTVPPGGEELTRLVSLGRKVAEAMEKECVKRSAFQQSERVGELVESLVDDLSHGEVLSLSDLLRGDNPPRS